MKIDEVFHYQNLVLSALSNKIDSFCLGGGTALSLFYFRHRVSFDLDFFTQSFSPKVIERTISFLRRYLESEDSSGKGKIKITLAGKSLKEEKAKVMVYYLYFSSRNFLKVDFIEDAFPLIKQPMVVEGIKIFSLEDIYLRKIYTVTGTGYVSDRIGKKRFVGGREDAKDLFDIYFLSHTFMPLSQFVKRYGDYTIKEGLIAWFRSYDRLQMIDGILNLDTDKSIDYRMIESHIGEEIDKIIEAEIEEI